MMRPYVLHVPKDIWVKFIQEEIDHFEYDVAPGRSVAVYADGTREEFDSAVTEERIQEWEEEQRQALLKRDGAVMLLSWDLTAPAPVKHHQLKKVGG